MELVTNRGALPVRRLVVGNRRRAAPVPARASRQRRALRQRCHVISFSVFEDSRGAIWVSIRARFPTIACIAAILELGVLKSLVRRTGFRRFT